MKKIIRSMLIAVLIIGAAAVMPDRVQAAADYTVSVDKGYLALRSGKAYTTANEIGELYSGDTVQVKDSSDPSYWYVYAPRLALSGYVNKDYLIEAASYANTWTVSVQKGYLALRNAKSFDASNEIGKLYSNDTVQVLDASDPTYWYVYAPGLKQKGYVNQQYLYSQMDNTSFWEVSVAKGYLALRTSKEFDASNEIGSLNNGQQVQVLDDSDPSYWYVYSPELLLSGYVNADYLIQETAPSNSWTVSVAKGYLALRSAPAYDAANEVGELYTGDSVWVQDTEHAQYWYVYSPRLNMYGYVNADYLF